MNIKENNMPQKTYYFQKHSSSGALFREKTFLDESSAKDWANMYGWVLVEKKTYARNKDF